MTQLILEGAPTHEIEAFVEFTIKVGIPNSFFEVALRPENESELRAVAKAATVEEETINNMPFPVTTGQLLTPLTPWRQSAAPSVPRRDFPPLSSTLPISDRTLTPCR